jgi:hypothetical protein
MHGMARGGDDLTSTSYGQALTAEDIASFKQNGLLVKKGLLDPSKAELSCSICRAAARGGGGD